MTENRCCICNDVYEGMGNNAEPFEKGRCCDKCNELVITYRLHHAKPDFQKFESNLKLIYDDLENKSEFYKQHLKEIDESSDVLETLKANCSVVAKDLIKAIDKNKRSGKLISSHELFDVPHTDTMFEYAKIKVGELPIFEINDNVMELMDTKNKIYPRNMPFDNFAVFFPKHSVPIMKTAISIFGIVIYSKPISNIFEKYLEEEDSGVIMKVIIYNAEEETEKFKVIELMVNKNDWTFDFNKVKVGNKDIYLFNKVFNQLMEIFVNFLDYLNHPQCVRTLHKHSYNNKKRISSGKIPLNDVIKIDVGGDLLRIIYRNKEQAQTSRQKPDIRGHYFHFRNKEHYKKIYDMDGEEVHRKGYFIRLDNLIAKWKLPVKINSGNMRNKRRILT